MAELWQRIKNWIIKKMGGYTKAEYDDMSRRPAERFVFTPQPDRRGIITLRTEATLDTYMSVPHEWVEGRMLDELAKQMKPFVVWEFSDDYMDFRKKVRASVKVVDRHA